MVPIDTNNGNGISIWFVCKICRSSFIEIHSFMQHKKYFHFDEFRNLSCIIFEERCISTQTATNFNFGLEFCNSSSSLIPLPAAINKESITTSAALTETDENLLDVKPNVFIFNEKSKAGPTKISSTNFQQVKSEPIFDSNPVILLKRLTSQEILKKRATSKTNKPIKLESSEDNFCKSQKVISAHQFKVPHSALQSSLQSKNCGKLWTSKPKEHLQTDCKTQEIDLIDKNDKTRFKRDQPNCEKLSFGLKPHTKNHILLHFENRPFKCQELNCGKAFKRQKYLRNHLKRHSDPGSGGIHFHCPFSACKKVFRQTQGLTYHFSSSHSQECYDYGSGNKLFKYEQCERSDCLTSRYQRGGDKKPFKCPQTNCTKEFKHESTLRNHSAKHSKLRLYKCTMPNCNKTFKTPYNVKTHVKSHTQDKPE